MISLPARHRGESFATFHGDMDPVAFLDKWAPSNLILSKGFCPSILRLAREARRRAVRVIAVLSDDRSTRPKLFDIDREMCGLASEIVVQTSAMANFVERSFGRASHIIEEPLEVPIQPPRGRSGSPPRVLWYGREDNHDTLEPGLGPLVRNSDHPMVFELVTNRLSEAVMSFAESVARRDSKSIIIRRWSLEIQRQALRQADIVVIPSVDRPDKHVKGHNRLVEAIASGVYALAYPLSPYRELAEFCWCGEDFIDGMNWFVAHPEAARQALERGQEHVRQRFSIGRIAELWDRVLA